MGFLYIWVIRIIAIGEQGIYSMVDIFVLLRLHARKDSIHR